MGHVISEGLENIGRIDDNGFVFDQSGDCVAKIDESGYINKLAGFGSYGKIDADGTIRNSSMDVVGRIQGNGYVYIHSERVCHVSSEFIERITPNAWNAGQPSTYSGRGGSTSSDEAPDSSRAARFFTSGFFIKLVIGIVLGIIAMVNGVGGIGMLLAGPIFVFLFSLIWKIFNH